MFLNDEWTENHFRAWANNARVSEDVEAEMRILVARDSEILTVRCMAWPELRAIAERNIANGVSACRRVSTDPDKFPFGRSTDA